MKAIKSNKPSKYKNKKGPILKPKKEKVLVVAQEFKFARLLSGNEKKTRDRVLKTLKKWLFNSFEKGYEFKEDDFIRVWKGLFYAVWMSDKPLVQEDLCESIAEILDLFPPEQLKYALMMTKAGFKVLATEWYGIDHHRMDKFLMLVRRYLRGSFRCLLRCEWSLNSCEKYADMLTSEDGILSLKTPMYARNALSLILHITDCYLEELAKVSKSDIPEESLAVLLGPFTAQVTGGEALPVCTGARRLLTELVRQSDLGLEYQAATQAWQEMGCPAGGPDALRRESDDEDQSEGSEDEELPDDKAPLDPRAGRVSVVLRPLRAPATLLAAQLRRGLQRAAPKAHVRARLCLQRFEELAQDRYPLRLTEEEARGPEPGPPAAESERAAARLRSLERRLVSESDELALRGLRRKHRKRLLARSRAGACLVDEVGLPTAATNGKWQVEETKPAKKQSKEDSNKENENKRKNRKRKRNDRVEENIKVRKSDNATTDKLTKKQKKENDKNKKRKKQVNEESTNKLTGTLLNGPINKESKTKVVKPAVDKETKDTKTMIKTTIKEKLKPEKKPTANERLKTNPVIKVNKNAKIKTNEGKTKKVLGSKIKNFQKQIEAKKSTESPKKVKFMLKNNSMQGPVDYYKSVRESPSIPFDSSKKPTKTNLKPSTPSPINPFFKKKLRLRN